jgi:hypothetical protein
MWYFTKRLTLTPAHQVMRARFWAVGAAAERASSTMAEVCLMNNAAERALRGEAVGKRNRTFAGSDAGGHRAAAVYTLTETCSATSGRWRRAK